MMRDRKGNSLLSFPASYVALDIETTGLDPQFDEIIELAAVKIENGAETARFQTLVKPKEDIDGFITALTGITNDMVRDAPAIEAALPAFLAFVGESAVVGHNVNFDVNFLYDTAERLGLPPFSNDIADTMRISRRLYPDLKNHKLSTLISHLGVGQSVEHRALSDCLQTQQCFEKMRDYADSIGGVPVAKKVKLKSKDITPETEEFDPDSPLYGMTFVFTGALERMTRREAMQTVVNAGGSCKDSVSKKVNYLVLGNLDYANGMKNGKSTKQKAAEKLQLSGADIEVISENVFYDMLGESQGFSNASGDVKESRGSASRDGIQLSAEEEAAVSAILSATGDLAQMIHLERRSHSYLSLVIPEHGRDFCRVKSSPRTLWMSLDMCLGGILFPDDPRLAEVQNKNQRHWKIPLSSVEDISDYSDLIALCAQSALAIEEVRENPVAD